MARTLTAATATEAAKTEGAFPRWILEIAFASGTKFWSTESLTSPVTAEGRIINIGQLNVSGAPGQAASIGTLEMEVEDSDLFLFKENETKPGIQTVQATLYIWFEGTTWPDDRITEFAGILTTPMRFDENTATWSITLKGLEHKFDKEIGKLATTDIFSGLRCDESQNTLIPIVYGNPCHRVPMTVIDRPGMANLSAQLSVVDSTLTINATADEAGFPDGVSVILIVGHAGRWERITGSFASSGTNVFDIATRGSVLAEGTLPTPFGSGGFQFIMVPQADLPDTTSRGGHFIFLHTGSGPNDGPWTAVMMSRWALEGTNIIVVEKGQLDVQTGSEYKIGSKAGVVPSWGIGTPVMQQGSWKYLANFLPSESVDRIEAPSEIDVPGGDRTKIWLKVNASHWSADLNDQSFNSALGRGAGDDGLTTVTVDFVPTQLGFPNETLYATIKGSMGNGATALEDPTDVMKDILENEFLGNVPSANIDDQSFTDAAASISTKFSFALLDERKSLHELVSELADQANSIFFWDEGKAVLRKLDAVLSAGDSQATITKDEYSLEAGLQVDEMDVKQFITELTGKFRPAVPAPELTMVRKSNDAITDFGIKRDEKRFWAYQAPTSVGLALESWLEFFLENNRQVTFTSYLNLIDIQPGDTITLDIDDGDGNILFDSVLARVRKIIRVAGNAREGTVPATRVMCDVRLYDYTVVTGSPSQENCVGNLARKAFERTGKLYLQSSGTGRSLYVDPGGLGRIDGAGDNVEQPVTEPSVDPTDDFVVSTGGDIGEFFPTRIDPNALLGTLVATLNEDLTEGGSASATTLGGETIIVNERVGSGQTIPEGTTIAVSFSIEHPTEPWTVVAAECI